MRKYSSSIVHNSSSSIYCDIYIQAKICFYLLQKTIFSSISLILQSAKWGYFIWNEIYVQWNTSSSSFLEMNFGTISKFQKLKQNLQNILLFKWKKNTKKIHCCLSEANKTFSEVLIFLYSIPKNLIGFYRMRDSIFASPWKQGKGVLFQL